MTRLIINRVLHLDTYSYIFNTDRNRPGLLVKMYNNTQWDLLRNTTSLKSAGANQYHFLWDLLSICKKILEDGTCIQGYKGIQDGARVQNFLNKPEIQQVLGVVLLLFHLWSPFLVYVWLVAPTEPYIATKCTSSYNHIYKKQFLYLWL